MSWKVKAKDVKKYRLKLPTIVQHVVLSVLGKVFMSRVDDTTYVLAHNNFVTFEQFKSWFDKDNWENLKLIDIW